LFTLNFELMRIWIDLANSPHVPFFHPLIAEFRRRGHEVLLTARRFAQTVELAERAGLQFEVVGGHGGRRLAAKFNNIIGRGLSLASWARTKRIDLAVSHNSYAAIVAAAMLRLKSATLMDYEHQPANHLAFRLASRVIVPRSFPDDALHKFGANSQKVFRYDGIKEDVYLADFAPDDNFTQVLQALGILPDKILVVVRPPARDALYHRFENELFDDLIRRLSSCEDVKVIFLARTAEQREVYQSKIGRNFVLPEAALDGANLIYHADLIVSAGGTMNREAAALGVPAATVYAGQWAAIDEYLVSENRLTRIKTASDLANLEFVKKPPINLRQNSNVKSQVADLILNER
jgi:hypothetical protein